MTLLPKLDERQTKKNAREVLRNCRRFQRLSGFSTISEMSALQSPVISDMPRHQSNRNNAEHKMIKSIGFYRKMESSKELLDIKAALDALSDVSRKILHYSYCINNPYTVVKISNKITIYKEDEFGNIEQVHYSPKNIEKLKGIALIEFAEAYKNGILLSYEK